MYIAAIKHRFFDKMADHLMIIILIYGRAPTSSHERRVDRLTTLGTLSDTVNNLSRAFVAETMVSCS